MPTDSTVDVHNRVITFPNSIPQTCRYECDTWFFALRLLETRVAEENIRTRSGDSKRKLVKRITRRFKICI